MSAEIIGPAAGCSSLPTSQGPSSDMLVTVSKTGRPHCVSFSAKGLLVLRVSRRRNCPACAVTCGSATAIASASLEATTGPTTKPRPKRRQSVKPSIYSEAQASVKCDCRQNKTLADRRTGNALI